MLEMIKGRTKNQSEVKPIQDAMNTRPVAITRIQNATEANQTYLKAETSMRTEITKAYISNRKTTITVPE
jgi:hypothetical protein